MGTRCAFVQGFHSSIPFLDLLNLDDRSKMAIFYGKLQLVWLGDQRAKSERINSADFFVPQVGKREKKL